MTLNPDEIEKLDKEVCTRVLEEILTNEPISFPKNNSNHINFEIEHYLTKRGYEEFIGIYPKILCKLAKTTYGHKERTIFNGINRNYIIDVKYGTHSVRMFIPKPV